VTYTYPWWVRWMDIEWEDATTIRLTPHLHPLLRVALPVLNRLVPQRHKKGKAVPPLVNPAPRRFRRRKIRTYRQVQTHNRHRPQKTRSLRIE
jgi:hypothetical protein